MAAMLTPEPTAPPVFLNTCETAALLRCSPKTLALDRVRRRWRVPFLKLGGRRVVYERSAVLRWLADRNPSARLEG
jgi:hypothetical protein